MKNRKNIWKITLSLFISGLLLFSVGCSDDDDTKPKYDIIYGGGVTDIDGNEYATVIIGNQEWTAENLRVTRYNNEDDIPTGLSDEDWGNTTDGAYAIYDYNHFNADGINSPEEMVAAYGKLYNFYAVDDERGLCPEGWHVPSDDDWTQLVNYVVAQGFPNISNASPIVAGNALKSCRQVDSPLGGCNTSEHPRWEWTSKHHGFDEFGFSALPGGSRYSSGSYGNIGQTGDWWESLESSSSFVSSRFMLSNYGDMGRFRSFRGYGHSVRCLRDID